jgi:hypothetical protein
MAYGAIRGASKPPGTMPARIYPLGPSRSTSASCAAILTVPFDFGAGDHLSPALEAQLCSDFNG